MKLCDLDLSRELQELGYDGEYSAWIDTTDGSVQKDSAYLYDWHIPCPRLDDAAYWLRERHGLIIYVTYLPCSRQFCPHILDMMGNFDKNVYYPYEAADCDTALENAVKKAITLIKMRFV